MCDSKFFHSPSSVSTIVSNLKINISDYKEKIIELDKLIGEIAVSPSWKDEEVKTSFINTCRSYINLYKNLSYAMENYVSYLSSKSSSFTNLENSFSGGKL